MTRAFEPKLVAYVTLAAAALVAALAARLPELVALGAPFALVPLFGVLISRAPRVEIDVALERDRALEGDEAELVITVAGEGVDRLDVLLELGRGIRVVDDANPVAFALPDGRRRDIVFRLDCIRWGAYRVGRVYVRARDAFGLLRWEWQVDRQAVLKVYPREEALRSLVRPFETQVFAGNHVAREKAEGIEFADLRPFVAGDRVRRVNWRASARRGELWVNDHHAERNSDVVIFVDAFAEVGDLPTSTLDDAVRAAATLAVRYLRQRDRVAFVSFGGAVSWLGPGSGTRQLYRIVDSMLDTQIAQNSFWRDIDAIPRRTLPPRALVLALSPLLDDRGVSALIDLRARGFDVALFEISPLPFMPAAVDEVEEAALRIWRLRREALRGTLEAAGIAVAVWDEERPLVAAAEEVRAFREHARLARV